MRLNGWLLLLMISTKINYSYPFSVPILTVCMSIFPLNFTLFQAFSDQLNLQTILSEAGDAVVDITGMSAVVVIIAVVVEFSFSSLYTHTIFIHIYSYTDS